MAFSVTLYTLGRREELAANPQRVNEILDDGASAARKKAGEVLARVKKACGLSRK